MRSMAQPEWFLDTNELDALLADESTRATAEDLARRRLARFTMSHVQLDQISTAPEPRRTELRQLTRGLRIVPVYTEVFVLGMDAPLPKRGFGGSRLGGAKLSDEAGVDLFNRLASGDPGSVSDAVIATTAILRNVPLVTNDDPLRRRVHRVVPDAVVLTHAELGVRLRALKRARS
jgi:predicted nucleic acid-binding protein